MMEDMFQHEPYEKSADATWFHVFRQMFDSGDVAKLGAHAFTLYCAIKQHVNFATGEAFPSIERLIELTGISRAQVMRDLKKLEEYGFLTKEKRGRNSVYTLREKVQIVDGTGRPVAEATWDYLPAAVKGATAELRNYVQTGEVGQIVHIEHLIIQNLNIVQANSGSEVEINNLNVQTKAAKDDALRSAREILERTSGKK